MSAWVRVTTRIYKRLVRWFPHKFQIRHGDNLENLGEDSAAFIAERYGAFGLVRLLVDACLRLIAKYAAKIARDVHYAGEIRDRKL